MSQNLLKLAIPTGSLQDSVLTLLGDAGYELKVEARSYRPEINDPEIWVKMLRPQEIPSLVEEGVYDVGISGRDWVFETQAEIEQVLDLMIRQFAIVLAVSQHFPVNSPGDLSSVLTSLASLVSNARTSPSSLGR